jgi:hypothetical protein
LYADFCFDPDELDNIREMRREQKEIDIVKKTELTGKQKNTVYCEVRKTIYIAEKTFFKQKRKLGKATV